MEGWGFKSGGGEGGPGKGAGWEGGNHGLHREDLDDLDKDTGDVDSQSCGTSDEYFYDEVTDTVEGWVF